MSYSSCPPWKLYEQEVAKLVKKMGNSASVRHDAKILGHASHKKRQVDVWIEGMIADVQMNIAVECKRYPKKRVGIDLVESFIGKLIDIGADRGIMYAYSGFTRDGESRARGARQPFLDVRQLAEFAVAVIPLGVPEPYEERKPRKQGPSGDVLSSMDYLRMSTSRTYTVENYAGIDIYEDFLVTGNFPLWEVDLTNEIDNRRKDVRPDF